jgi:redox-sensitive bicupin YhaK (pirin superfamily)
VPPAPRPFEIGRGRHQEASDLAKTAGDQVTVIECARANRKVNTVTNDVDAPLGKSQLNLHIRIGGRQLDQMRGNQILAKRRSGCQRNMACNKPFALGYRPRGILGCGDRWLCHVIDTPPLVRQRQCPRRAPEQRRAQQQLKVGKPAADGGFGKAKCSGCGCEAAFISNGHEQREVVERWLHCSKNGTLSFQMQVLSRQPSGRILASTQRRESAMIHFSSVYTATQMRRGAAFSARQYPRQAFDNLIDPVLNIDWFEMSGPTFPPHPHAGFSAVTYLFADSPNGFINRDSFGDVQDIRPGGLHWSRASRGMMHEETPVPDAGPVRGLQIFVNLPAASQADPAAAFAVPAAMVKSHSGKGWEGRVSVDGTTLGESAEALPSPVRIEEISLDTWALRDIDVPAGWGGILIMLEGSLSIGEVTLDPAQAIGFAADVDGQFRIATPLGPARIALISGAQLKQPIFAYGPLMLASPASLDEARRRVGALSV